jgi:predicted DNA-binding transcriptional regulator YafY
VVSSDEHNTIFRYHLVPTFDFKQELLGRGASVEVLSPDWFRDEVAADVAEMAKMYGV